MNPTSSPNPSPGPEGNLPVAGPPDHSSHHAVALFIEITAAVNDARSESVLATIAEFGGRVGSASDNSVLAWFSDGEEAVKAAINIQVGLNSANQGTGDGDRVNVKAGIDCRNPVSGGNAPDDTAGMASRLARSGGLPSITVSRRVCDAVRDMPHVHFEPVNLPYKTGAADDQRVYGVTWDRAADFKPATGVVLYFRPLWGLGSGSFPRTWDAMVREEMGFWGAAVGEKLVLPDNSLALALRDSGSVLRVVRAVLRYLGGAPKTDGERVTLPVHAFVHIYPATEVGELTIRSGDFPVSGVNPGDVYISPEALKHIRNQRDIPVEDGPSPVPSWHKVGFDNMNRDGEAVRFLHQEALAAGEGEPCFYCGSRRHKAGMCPSKHMAHNTHGLDRLGYLSMRDINELFSEFLSVEKRDPDEFYREVREGGGMGDNPAFQAFYELNRVYQLRFLRAIWYTSGNRWGRTAEAMGENKGGIQWLAQDSLRVSDTARAAALLKEAQIRHPEDYRIYCTLGYLYVEKGDLAEAEYFFNKALKFAKGNGSKIFVHFLLFRLNKLLGQHATAYRSISGILSLDSGCAEAIYEDMIIHFRQKDEKGALQRLVVLVSDERKYYVQALIDPELAPFRDVVADQLEVAFVKAKEASEEAALMATEEMERTRAILREKDLEEAEELMSRIEDLRITDSYFARLDTVRLGNAITAMCRNAVQEQQKEVRKFLQDLNRQLERDMAFVVSYNFPRLVGSHAQRLVRIRERLRAAEAEPPPSSPEEINARILTREKLQLDLSRIEAEFGRLENWRQILLNGFKFVRNSIILLSIVIIAGVFLFPLAVRGLNAALSSVDIPAIADTGMFQKTFIILGGAASLIIPLLITMKSLFGSDRTTKGRKR